MFLSFFTSPHKIHLELLLQRRLKMGSSKLILLRIVGQCATLRSLPMSHSHNIPAFHNSSLIPRHSTLVTFPYAGNGTPEAIIFTLPSPSGFSSKSLA